MLNKAIIPGVLIGAAAMYIADPDRGGARRAWIRGKTAHCMQMSERAAGRWSRRMVNRINGVLARGRRVLSREAAPVVRNAIRNTRRRLALLRAA